MKKVTFIIINSIIFLSLFSNLDAQGPKGRNFGFGLILGDPAGITMNYFTNNENSIDGYIGSSYFGSLRIGGDYLWHFDAFNSNIIKMYVGPGLVLGFGNGNGVLYKEDHDKFYYWDNSTFGLGGRVIFGANFYPKNSPLEIFFELGPFIGVVPKAGVNFDVSIGLRFYP